MADNEAKYDFSGLDAIKSKYNFSGLDHPDAGPPIQSSEPPTDPLDNDTPTAGGILRGVLLGPLAPVADKLSFLSKPLETIKNTTDDFASGGVQGLTLGGADELSGAGEAIAANLTGTTGGKSLQELYRQYQQLAQQKSDQANERSPIAYKLGDLAGTTALGALTAGEGLALGGGAETLAGAGRTAAKEAFASGLGKEAARNAASAAVRSGLVDTSLTAAGAGGVTGALSSKGNLDTPEGQAELMKDALGGAALGAVAGPALRGAAEYIGPKISKMAQNIQNWTKDFVQDRDLLRQMKLSTQIGQEGTRIAEGQNYSGKVVPEYQLKDIRDVTNKFLDADKKLGAQFGDVLNTAYKDGVVVRPKDETIALATGLDDLVNKNDLIIGPGQTKDISTELQRLANGQSTGLDPKQIFDIRSKLAEMMTNIDNPEIRQVVSNLQRSLKGELEEAVPGIKDLSAQFKAFREAGPESLLAKGQPRELEDMWFGDLKRKQAALSNDVRELLGTLTTPGQVKSKAARTFSQLITNLEQFEKQNPGKLKELGFNSVNDLKNDILSKADRWAVDRQVLGYEPQSSWLTQLMSSILGSGSTTARGIQLDVMNRVGYFNKALFGDKNIATGMAKGLYNAPNTQLKLLADELKDIPALKYLGEALNKGLVDPKTTNKNAAMFAILQNPKARMLMSSIDFNNDSNPDNQGR